MRSWLETTASRSSAPLPTEPPETLTLGIDGFRYADLYDRERLEDLLRDFEAWLAREAPDAAREYADYRRTRGAGCTPLAISKTLILVAPHVAAFVARLFRIEPDYAALVARLSEETPIVRFREFVKRDALKRWTREALASCDAAADTAGVAALIAAVDEERPDDPEMAFANTALALIHVESVLSREGKLEVDAAELAGARAQFAEIATRLDGGGGGGDRDGRGSPIAGDDRAAAPPARALAWVDLVKRRAAWLHHFGPERRAWPSLRLPEKLDFQNLVHRERPDAALPEVSVGQAETLRRRDGFGLTDPRMDPRGIRAEVEYCVLCHENGKDSCSRGYPADRKDAPPKKNPLGIVLDGCPLDERISEAHALRRDGESIAALAMIMIDNPMLPGTGHRICNDCMKACIFQKQEPVNIPQAETGILSEVLSLPYGAEIYLLLTRWNPLNVARPAPATFHGKSVLVVGLGPAGYTLAHHLLNEGFGVVAIDGLKIEPLPEALAGTPGRAPEPIRDFHSVYKKLDERILAGFGGVSEYGITVRWDKNFLMLIHLALVRREAFRLFGGVRFGGTVTLADCWALGFDHVAIAAGAGKPTVVEMEGGLARGVRAASDFLMALQLTGAFKRESLANLQVRLPAIVIGGGLTAIDTATELLAYYPIQVEKVLERFETLASRHGADTILARFDEEERAILDEFLAHGRAVRAERERARAAGETPDLVGLAERWGGVTIAYRRTLQESPAYRLNHEEVIKCLEEGVRFAERLAPIAVVRDRFGAVEAIEFDRMSITVDHLTLAGERIRLPARAVMMAAGTSPNVIYEREHPGTFRLDAAGKFFAAQVVERDARGARRLRAAAAGERGFFTSYERDGHLVSYYGDNHPVYAGSVVKAMASARDGFPKIVELFAEEIRAASAAGEAGERERRRAFLARASELADGLTARVVRVDRLTPTITEVIVRAPIAARKFQPGQFYRLQNYETESPLLDGTRLALEGIALTGAWVDREEGLLSLIVLEMGASSRLCAALRPGQPVIVMGPTGCPSEIPRGEKILLAGGGLGNAVLFSIAKAMRDAGNTVVYFAGYKDGIDLFKREEIEDASDQVIWSTDGGLEIARRRPQDRHFRGNIVQAILAYAKGELGEVVEPLPEVNRILAIGSDRMMAAVGAARHGVLAPHLGEHVAIASINSSMQCMMKAICGQCLQQHVDPVTGEPTEAVFSCYAQDQPLDAVDFANLSERLRMNSVQEKLSNLWLDDILARHAIDRV